MDPPTGDSSAVHSVLRKRKYRVCPHCSCELSYKKFKEHKTLFYNDITKVWVVDVVESETDLSDFSEVDELVMCSDGDDDSPGTQSDWEFSNSPLTPAESTIAQCAHNSQQDEVSSDRDEIEFWDENDSEIDKDVDVYCSRPPQALTLDPDETPESSILLKWIIFLLLNFQTKFTVTDQALQWILTCLHLVLRVLGNCSKEADYIS